METWKFFIFKLLYSYFELSNIFRQLSEYINDYNFLSPKGGGVALYFLMPSR